MAWNQFGDFIDLYSYPDLDPDPHSANFEDPGPYTINPNPHHWLLDRFSAVKKNVDRNKGAWLGSGSYKICITDINSCTAFRTGNCQ